MKLRAGYSQTVPKRDNPNLAQGFTNQLNDLKSQMIPARVLDIVLDENHPKFNEVGQLNGIGTIYYGISNQSGPQEYTHIAKPYNPQSKTFPLINEIVLLFSLPDQTISQNSSNTSYYYLNPLSIWNHPHHNAYPNPFTTTLPAAQNQDYKQVEGGSVRRVTDSSTEIDLNSPINPSQNTFVEKIDIHPLMPFMGDVLYEGRHGQSIRLGSTAKSLSAYANNWSSVGNNGDPITILRNGQPSNSTPEGWIPVTEDIRRDLASIYLTSTQQLKDFKVASELYDSYSTPPLPPSQFTNPQIALTSDRIVINAKTDSILLSSQKSIGFSTNGTVNMDTKSFYVSSNDIKLGSRNATEPVLKGDTTVEMLKQLTKAVKDLATILEVDKNWPGGNLQTGYNAVAGNVILTLNSVVDQLNDGSLKSKTTKVQ